MRYVSGLLLGTAAAAHTGGLVHVLGLGLLVSAGVIAFAFAIEAIVSDALKARPIAPPPRPPSMPATTDDAQLRKWFNQPPR